jgi:hypothetical protein
MNQTGFYDPNDAVNPNKGTCAETALASLLNIPIPSKFGPSGTSEEYWDDFERCLAQHGCCSIYKGGNSFYDEVMYLASGPSSRGTHHMVVMRSGKLVHDPHPSGEGLLQVDATYLIVPLDVGAGIIR